MISLTLPDLKRYAIARSLFTPTSLARAITRLGFVQADPIRSPARAQDLTLRHRVKNYRAGDLERLYPKLQVEEDFFVNYGFLTPDLHALMHPRVPKNVWTPEQHARSMEVLAFIKNRGVVHPHDVEEQFLHGKARNWFGGSSNVSTQLLDAMHYRGLLRVARREGGTRLYEAREQAAAPPDPDKALDALIDTVTAKYAPLPSASLGQLLTLLSGGAPQWKHLKAAAFKRAQERLPCCVVDGVSWYWPVGENPASRRWQTDDAVRLLAPFDPVVWDRRRFELFWGWAYRFEAYTPAAKRVRGYYAMPLLWRDQVIGWANITRQDARMQAQFGYVSGKPPPGAAYKAALQAELASMAQFLDLSH